MNEYQKLAVQALSNMMGDDTARAKSAFRNCTSKQMQEQYGDSGKTRTEVLAGYEQHDAKVQAAIDWVKGLLEF